MKRMTTEVIAALQELVDTYGDLPFEVLDADNGVDHLPRLPTILVRMRLQP